MFDKEKSWILNHEKLLIIVLVLAVVVYLGGKYLDGSSEAAIAKNAVAQQVLQEQVSTNAAIAKQLAAQVGQYQQMVSTLSAQNNSLSNAIGTRQVALQRQQEINATLPLPKLAERWGALAGVPTTEFKSTPEGVSVTDNAARATVQILDSVATLQQDFRDTKQIAKNNADQLVGATGVITGLNGQVDGLKKELVDKDKASQALLKLERAKARKGKLKAFIFGVGVGVGVTARLIL